MPASDPETIAAAFLSADRAVVLTGLALGAPETADRTHGGGEWATRASLEAFLTEPSRFWEYFYPEALTIASREPTAAHHALARLERAGLMRALITQAVDRLHSRAGTLDPVEVHGSIITQRCERCGEIYGLPEVGELIGAAADGVPRCTTPGCDYPLRPEGTLWGEALPQAAIERAWELAAETDLFVVLDSDLRTAPISLLPSVPLTRGAPLVIVSQTPTQYDRYARTIVRSSSAEVMVAVADLIAPEA